MSIKPEWLKRLEEAITNLRTTLATELNLHKLNTDIHRTIHISTVSPTNADGEDGDIWITIEP
jgi:hypothetical protein